MALATDKSGEDLHTFFNHVHREILIHLFTQMEEKMEDMDVLWRHEWHRKEFLDQTNWMMKFNSWHIILMHIQGIHLNSTEPLEGGRLCV